MFGCPEEGWKIGYMNLSLPAEGSGHFYWKSNFADVLFQFIIQMMLEQI
jgi:hypothetical protein